MVGLTDSPEVGTDWLGTNLWDMVFGLLDSLGVDIDLEAEGY